jgi:oligogalacturonide transport system permease protein
MGGDSKYLGLAYVAPYVIGLLLFTAFPFVASFYLCFTDYDLISAPEWTGLDNYEKLFTRDRTFTKSLNVTLLYVFLTVPLKLVFALFIAVILNYRLKAINLFRTAYYVPSILGGSIAIAVLWRYIFASEGLVNMILAYFGVEPINWFGDPQNALLTITLLRCWQFGSAMVIFLAALQSVDKSLYEAAAIDGANPWHLFRYITLPQITTVIFFNLIMQTVQAFQEFNGPYIITLGGPL